MMTAVIVETRLTKILCVDKFLNPLGMESGQSKLDDRPTLSVPLKGGRGGKCRGLMLSSLPFTVRQAERVVIGG